MQFDTAPTQSNAQPQIELSTIFLTFHWDQLGNIRQRGWIERLKISKVDKFESDLLKTNENIATQSRDILQTFVWWEASSFSTPPIPLPPPPPYEDLQTSAKFATLRSCFFARFGRLSLKRG